MTVFYRSIPAVIVLIASCFAFAAAQRVRQHNVGSPGDLVAIYFTSASKGFIAGDAGYLASTSDGGTTWRQYPLGTNEDITEIYFRNDNNGYLVAGRKLFITGDAGTSWRETTILPPGILRSGTPSFLSIRFSDKKTGFAIGSVINAKGNVSDSLVMRTSDGGSTWQRLIVPSKTELFHLDFDGKSNGWIVGDNGVILATTDGGDTWRPQASGTRNALYNVDFRDQNEGYAVGVDGTILRTANGGAAWQKVTTAFPGNFMRVHFADDKTGWIAGHGGVVLRSTDRGATWVRVESGTTHSLYGLYVGKKYGWAVGAKGTVLEFLR